MEYGYSILMFVFAAFLFLYGLITLITGDITMVRKYWAARITDKKRYARQFGKVIMILSTAPFVSGAVGLLCLLFGEIMIIPALIVLAGGIAGGIILGIRLMPPAEEEE